ncbi:uncharacterized protein C12orf60 homolog [Lepus europaeus]|uniref:uncharacterized protein C12orf60 homolog n=1 Tax=Lepus europaeus TaxID=9983 RepID=UPI002B471C34|nr:uncharacterized protein C12orf60 homolog [Lepus europaeus]XP_062050857.1 uncharacterized protein C12orf60 homolog [Lepus europaeus]
MSSELEKDKERLVQAATTFFYHIRDLSSSINAFTELCNHSMNTQIPSLPVKEDIIIKDLCEQMLSVFKEVQSAVDAQYSDMQKEPICSKVAATMCCLAEKSANVKDLQQSAKDMLRNVHSPVLVSALKNSNVLGSLESSLSLLMKSPIMSLQLSDFHREDTKEQPDATASEKTMSPDPSKATTVDTLKKLQDALKTENTDNPIGSAADHLEHIVKTMEPTIAVLQKSRKAMEMGTSVFKKVDGK